MPAGLISIDIEARLAKLEEGVTRANRNLDGFGKAVDRASARAKAAFASLAGAFSVTAIVVWSKETIAAAESLHDLADATGSSIEALSRLNNIAKIGGGSFEDVKAALERLAAGLAGAEEGTTKTADALRFLNITARDPAQALEEIAKKLNTFADGAGKAAIARDLFGRSGVGFLATLRDIAEKGDVVATITTQQVSEAHRLGEAYRRLSVSSTTLRDAFLNNVVPPIANAIEQMAEGTKIAGGFFEALRLFGTINPFRDLAGNIAETRKELEALADRKSNFLDRLLFGGILDKRIDDENKKLAFLKFVQRQSALALIDPSNDDARDLRLKQRPPLSYTSNKPAVADKISEAQRYLEALQRQAEKLAELSAVETALGDIQKGRLKGLTPEISAQVFAIAEQIDAFKALTKEIEDGARAFEDQVRAAKEANAEIDRAANAALDSAERAAEGNAALRDEIAIILGGEAARKALEKERIDTAIATKEEALAMAQLDPLRQSEADALRIEVGLLKERRELLDGRDFAEALRADAAAVQALIDKFNGIGASAFSNFLQDLTSGKGIKSAISNFGNSLFTSLNQVVSDRISEQLFGKGGPFSIFGETLSSLFGGGKDAAGAAALTAAGSTLTASGTILTTAGTLLTTSAAALTAAAAAQTVSSAASGAGGIFNALSAFQGPQFGFAANGSEFTSGMPYVVGERGPEVVVPRRGSQIVPNHRLGGDSITVNLYPPQNINTQTARHMAKQAADFTTTQRRRG